MSSIAGIIILFLVIGVVGAIVKRLFRMALFLGVIALLIAGAVIFAIGGMH